MSEGTPGSAPIVSVIVPAHDAASYLSEALESLRAQTVTDIEVLVIDDGSGDATACIAESFVARDARFQLLRRDVASGKPACARNVGLRSARGTYVALLDADDIAVPTRLEVSLRALRLTGASLAFGDFRKFEDSDGANFERPHLEERQFLERADEYLERADDDIFRCSSRFAVYLLTDIPAINTQTFFAVRTDLLAAGLFDESLVGGEDLDLFLRLVERYPAVYIDAVQTLMRLHVRSLTATRKDRCVEDAIRVRRAHVDLLRAQMTGAERRGAMRAIAGMLADLGYDRWVQGARTNARAALAESWRLHPDSRIAWAYVKAWLPREPLLRIRRLLTRSVA